MLVALTASVWRFNTRFKKEIQKNGKNYLIKNTIIYKYIADTSAIWQKKTSYARIWVNMTHYFVLFQHSAKDQQLYKVETFAIVNVTTLRVSWPAHSDFCWEEVFFVFPEEGIAIASIISLTFRNQGERHFFFLTPSQHNSKGHITGSRAKHNLLLPQVMFWLPVHDTLYVTLLILYNKYYVQSSWGKRSKEAEWMWNRQKWGDLLLGTPPLLHSHPHPLS